MSVPGGRRGFDGSRLDATLAAAVASHLVPHVVAVVADADGVIYSGAAGSRVQGAGQAPGQDLRQSIGVDSLFKIASMTKPVTTAAALQLVEQGRLDLEAPVDAYLPEFAELQVLDGFDRDTPILRPPRGRATVRRLAVHTAGLGYWFWNAGLARWEAVTGTPNVLSGRAAALRAPLVADPGAGFEYGIATDWLGLVVERVAGRPLDSYVEEHLTGPLGMASTTFRPDAAQRARLVPVHRREEPPGAAGPPGTGVDGGWRSTRVDWVTDPDWCSGGHGLYSTPRDYAIFQRALLRGGEVDGVRILAERTVADVFTPQIGDLSFPAHIATADPRSSADVDLGPGLTWGLGLLLNRVRTPGMRAAGSGGWSGIFNTSFWVDHRTGITAAIYTQLLPFMAAGAARTCAEVERAVYAGLAGPGRP
jgi:methyl acetate hydrolase